MFRGILDGIEMALADAAAACSKIGKEAGSRQWGVGKPGTANDFREGFPGFPGGAEHFVSVHFECDGLCWHTRKMHEIENSANFGWDESFKIATEKSGLPKARMHQSPAGFVQTAQ